MTTTTTTTLSSNPPRQHGVKGVYYAGEWLGLENCEGKFNVAESGCSGCNKSKELEPCPRSASRNANIKNTMTSDDSDSQYDVCIIGAGCIGAAVARELSKYSLKILWLEAADDVSQGATKGNSGIVHAGYDDKPGTNHAKYCWKGNQMFKDLDRDLRFGYQVNGSFVLCTKEEDRKILKELMERGKINGVENLRIVEKKELFEMEPHLNPNCIAALYAPDAGNVIPYEFTIALAENAVDNGVELRIRREVTAIEPTKDGMTVTIRHWEPQEYVDAVKGHGEWTTERLGGVVAAAASAAASLVLGQKSVASSLLLLASIAFCGFQLYSVYLTKGGVVVSKLTPLIKLVAQAGRPMGRGGQKVDVESMKVGGSGSSKIQHGVTVEQETIRTKFVINCAGGASDKIANMIGDTSFKIKPRVGDYLLLNRNQGHLTYRTLFPCPDPILGKGVLVQTTLWGNLILGPTARDMHLPEVRDMDSASVQEYILSKCKELVPTFDPKETIHAFCGARAKSDRGDWVIENSVQDGRMIHVAGIDSPGLAGSPAIALEVVRLLQESGCSLPKNPSFNPRRAPIIAPKMGMRGLKLGPVGKNDSDGKAEHQMSVNVICKCEKVTELEVVRALRRSLPIDSTQAIRKRTRAGMGHCQGDPDNYNCEARVKAIIARECGIPMDQVGGRPWPATSTLSQRWPDEAEKLELEQRMKA